MDMQLSSGARRCNARLLNLSALLMWFSMYAYVPILPAYAGSLGATAEVIGIIGGVYGILQIALRICLGYISDRLGKDRLLLTVGFSLMVVSALMFLLGRTVPWVIAARTTAGAAAAWWVIVSASYAKYQEEDQQVKGQALLSFSANAGKVLAALSCAVFAQMFGYVAAFVVSLMTGIVAVCLIFGLRDPWAETIEKSPIHLRQLFSNKDLLVFCILALISQMLSFAVPSTFTSVAAERIGADNMQLGLLQVVYFAAVSLTSLICGTAIYRKVGGIRVLSLSFLLGAVSCIPAFYATLPSIYLMNILSGTCYGITLAALAGFVIRAVSPHERGSATGIFQSIYAVGIFLGPVVAGIMIENISFDSAYWLFVLLCVGCAIACPVFIPKKYGTM